MNKGRVEKVKCPHCGHEQDFEFWDDIDIDLDPGMKNKIINEELFTYACEECHENAIMAFPCRVKSEKEGLDIWMIVGFDDEQKAAVDKTADAEKKTIRRITGSINELKEKLLISGEGLDDRVIEVLKLLCINEVAGELSSHTLSEVRFNKRTDGTMILLLVFLDKDPAYIDITMDMYDKVSRMFRKTIEEHTSGEGFEEIEPYWANKVIEDSEVIQE